MKQRIPALLLFTSHCSHPGTKEGRNVSSHAAKPNSGILILEDEGGEEAKLDTGGHLALNNLDNEKRLMDIVSKYRSLQK